MGGSSPHRRSARSPTLPPRFLDTNVCIAVLRGQPDIVRRFATELPGGDLRVSSITVFELVQGAAKSGRVLAEMAKINQFFDAGPTPVDFTPRDADAAGRLRANLASRGLVIGAYDLLIAGHGLSRNWTVVTANTREFQRVEGLHIEDWTMAASNR